MGVAVSPGWSIRLAIRDVLAAHGLGVILKTHDGTDWMSKWDKTA
ncbi:MAG: hypothetical protein U0360_10555 [Dehalococcoidia bacterium]